MKLALVGTGRMGQAVERLALQHGHDIVARFDLDHPLDVEAGIEAFAGADVAIDFSLPRLALDHIRCYCAAGQTAVVGTTGWYEALDEVEAQVQAHGIGLFVAPNFSMGVAVLNHALRHIAPLIDQLPEFDLFVHERHHTGKVDSPSGTALLLAQTLVDGVSRKQRISAEAQHGRIAPDVLHVSSTRVGAVFGTHTVGFDSPFDQLSFVHEAKNRDGFAFGALKAAEWILGRKGVYTLDDLLTDWLVGK